MLRLYLDNCCYNRPFDDQTQLKINLETLAKLFIQQLIIDEQAEMIWSYMLFTENFDNPFVQRRDAIMDFSKHAVDTICENNEILQKAQIIQKTGIKGKDSIHIACAIFGKCDFMITTDNRMLKYNSNEIKIVDPIEFIRIWEGESKHE